MGALKQIVGVILILIAAIVAIHTVIEPVYHTSTDESPNSPIWDIINPLTAIAIILGLIFGYCRMSRAVQKFERSRVYRGERAILRIFVRSHTLFLELLRHQRRRERIYRCRCRCSVAGMDFLSCSIPVVERCDGCPPVARQCKRIANSVCDLSSEC